MNLFCFLIHPYTDSYFYLSSYHTDSVLSVFSLFCCFPRQTVQSFRNQFSDLNCNTHWRRKQVSRLNVIPPGGFQSFSFAWGKAFLWDFSPRPL